MDIHSGNYPKQVFDSEAMNYENIISTNLTGTILGTGFELIDTSRFAVTVVFTAIDTARQGHAILIETFVPVGIFFNVLNKR